MMNLKVRKFKTRFRLFSYVNELYSYLKIWYIARKDKYVEFGIKGGLGDAIMGTQFVNNIKSKIPDCKIIIFIMILMINVIPRN